MTDFVIGVDVRAHEYFFYGVKNACLLKKIMDIPLVELSNKTLMCFYRNYFDAKHDYVLS